MELVELELHSTLRRLDAARWVEPFSQSADNVSRLFV